MEMKSSKPIILIVLIILVASSFLSPSIASREDVVFEPAPTRSISESSVSYLIITTSDLKLSFEPLAQWRSQMGLKSSIISIDEITSSGDDDAEVIFNFISEIIYPLNESCNMFCLVGILILSQQDISMPMLRSLVWTTSTSVMFTMHHPVWIGTLMGLRSTARGKMLKASVSRTFHSRSKLADLL